MAVAINLNNRYGLDCRNPNAYFIELHGVSVGRMKMRWQIMPGFWAK
jgi:hypothetical protein